MPGKPCWYLFTQGTQLYNNPLYKNKLSIVKTIAYLIKAIQAKFQYI
jgi:hypothetical protein